MKKTILVLAAMLMISTVALADGIKFTEKQEWKKLVARAKKENKLIFLDAYASWCGPCKYLQSDVFTNKAVGDYFNSTYINVKIDMEEGEGPALADEFGVTAYPTLFFVNGDGKVVHKYVGALEADALIGLGKAAGDPEKQYFTVKAKATAGTLSPKAFHNWIHDAEKMEDEDLNEIITNYLEQTNAAFLEKDMLEIALMHAQYLPEKTLDALVANKTQVMSIIDYSEEKFKEAIKEKAVSFALNSSVQGEDMDLDKFRQIITKYSPEEAALETKKMEVKYYFFKDNTSAGVKSLAELIDDRSLKLPVFTLASLVLDRSKEIVAEGKGEEFIKKINAFKLGAGELQQGYYKDFAIMVIYYKMDNQDMTARMIKKIRADKDAPDEIKDLLVKFEKD